MSEQILQKLLSLRSDIRSNALINTNVQSVVDKILSSVDDDNIKLVVNKTWIDDKTDNDNIEAQKEIRNKGQIWASSLRADLSLIDKKTGKEIDRQNIKVATIPKVTDRNTFIIRGNEYQFMKQSRLKPGVYTKIQTNGEISSFFNVDKTVDFDRGFNNNFKINFEPEKKTFIMTYGTKNVPLINALRTLGVSREEMIDKWGKAVYEANASAYDRRVGADQEKLYEAIFGKKPDKAADVSKEIKDRLFATKLDPDVNRITLGKPYGYVGKEPILDASKKIIDINRGDVEPDDREALIFKSFYDVEDHMRDRLIKNSNKIVWNLMSKLRRNKSINKSISAQAFDPFVIGTITTNQLSTPPTQTNILSIIGDGSKMTVMGEGGIGSANAITNDARQISNSEAAFIDPLHTPEGGNIGITVHTAMDTVKIGKDLYSKFVDSKGKKTILRPIDVYDKYVGFPDQFDSEYKPKSAKTKAIFKGKMVEVPSSKIDYIIPDAMGMFDTSVNQIPFLDSIQGNRGLTASKMQEQALSLVNREKPLFDIMHRNGKSISKEIGQQIAVPKAKTDGVVEKITDKEIVINGVSHPLYHNFSLNAESFLNNEPIVKVGDTVKSGQIIADNNFTKDGQVALGVNLNVAYMPYKGLNYEDSTVVSESAAKKLTSMHMYDFKAKRSGKGVFSRSKFKAYYPEELPAKMAEKLDADGIIKPGSRIEHDDILIAHMERKAPTSDDIAVGRLDKQMRRDMADLSQRWDKDVTGIVTDVKKHGNSVVVSVKTEEPLKVADKISGLHGNKHIVSAILPDDQMPYNQETGERIDVTMNPIGVSNRINTSQLLEAGAGKIAAKTGEQFKIENFKDIDNTRGLLEKMKELGINEKDVLIDPATGKPFLNPVFTGKSHILKLEHIVDHKFSARYRDGYDSNEQPISGGHTGAKNLGRMEIAALLARGANENLKEMFNIKGQRNDAYWKAMETGASLPPPKSAFVKDKMLAMMAGAGINVEQKGKTFALRPMTDDEILERSRGELKNPTLTYRKKDMAPMKEGLYDPVKAGGIFGEHYTHFKLPEKVLNPVTATAAATILDMSVKDMEDIIDGKKFVDKSTGNIVKPGTMGAVSGGPAIEKLLQKVDVKNEMADAEQQIQKTTNPTTMNKLHRKIRYLKALTENKMKPTDYMIQNVLVIPSKYRPMFAMGIDGTVITSDINDLYQSLAASSESMKGLKKEMADVGGEDVLDLQLAEPRGSIYRDLKVIQGLQEPTSFIHKVKGKKKGYISQLGSAPGKQSKEGFFQDKVLERKQDLVGRSTIILNPELGGDQIGIPKAMASKIFQPFIMKKMVEWGYKPLEASKHIEDKSPIFQRALQVVSDQRLVIANRAPTIHRWNMTAFKPVLTDGKSIEVPAVGVSRNFGGDFDGDSQLSSIFISININKLRSKIRKNQKISFCDDLYIDLNSKIGYITSILKSMEVIVPSLEKLIVSGEKVVQMHISQFPRIEQTKKVKENGNEEYDVPEGISIFTIDNLTHKFKKVPVKTFSVHKNLPNYTIETSSGDSLLLSYDQSAVAINRSTWEIEKVTPEDLKDGRLIPKIRNTDIKETVFEIPLIDYSVRDVSGKNKTNHCKKSVKLDNDFGWLIGAMVGDGWVSNSSGTNQLCLSAMDENIGNKFCRIVNAMLDHNATPTIINNTHEFEGHQCFSKKYSITTAALTDNFVPWIGKGAYNKHLPPFYLSAPRAFREGVLAGLLDTDGTVCWLKKKKGRQFNIQYSSMSEVLIDEIVSLCRSLGISASISFGNKRSGGVERRAVLSTNTIHGKPLSIVHTDKSKAISEFYSEPLKDSSISARQDLVPFSPEIFMIAKEFVHHVDDKQLYGNISDAKRYNWRISRQSAKRLIGLDVNHKLPKRWIDIVNNEDVTWVYATSVKLNTQRVDMYDITAPGPYTFMLSNGIIVQDTFQIHTPISQDALEEARTMLPSASMLKTGYDTVLNAPQMDMSVGAFLASKGIGGDDTKLKFDDIEDARQAFKQNKFTYGDKVIINGKKATFGLHEINESVPDDMKKWDIELNQNNIDSWIKDVTKKHNGKIAIGLADKIKAVGNNYVTKFGFTLGLSDTVSDKEMQKKVIELANKGSDSITGFGKALPKAYEELKQKHGESTMLGIGIRSGGSKGIANTAAITMMPGILADANDKPIPIPVTRSYSEGLDTFGYWAAAHGARSGNIKKSVSSYMPGWLTKDMINSLYQTKIVSEEPIDNIGLEYSVDDRKGIMNRFLARDVKTTDGKIVARRNDTVDSNLINKLNQNKVKSIFVQSPLTDPTPGDGFSAYSYGTDYENKIHNRGDNIGIISAHTITEPSLNMAMKAFHTGGAATTGKGSATVFDRLDKLLRFQRTVPNKATLASADAKVKEIFKSPVGGWDVRLDNNEVRYIEPANEPTVKKGDVVSKGQQISTGTASVHDILKYRGMKDAQKFLVKELDDINDKKLDKRDIETIVRGITNTTRVMHPGSSNFVAGDVAPTTSIEWYNSNNEKEQDLENTIGDHLAQDIGRYKKHTKITKDMVNEFERQGVKRLNVYKDRIKHSPFLVPLGIGGKANVGEDWVSRLAASRLDKVFTEGATMGYKSNADELGHPVPGLVMGM